MAEAFKKMNLPLLFPCASKVKMPQLGSEEGALGFLKPRTLPPFLQGPGTKADPVSKGYVKKISADMVFAEDVVKERCFHMLPYDEKYFHEALKVENIITLPPKTKVPMGRHNNRNSEKKHMPCHLKKIHKQQPQREVVRDEIEISESTDDKSSVCNSHEGTPLTSPVFVTEGEEGLKTVVKPESMSRHEWDAYLMSVISSNTAHWIVHKRMSPSDHQDQLKSLLLDWYGETDNTDLIRDDTSEKEFEINSKPEKTPRKRWKKTEANLLDKVYGKGQAEIESSPVDLAKRRVSRGQVQTATSVSQPPLDRAVDPYSEDNKAPFYRQPAGLRRRKKREENETAACINATARDIEVDSYVPPPPVTLGDVINPKVGDKVFQTDNLYQQEWLTGVQQVSEPFGDKCKITMASNNTYRKKLQPSFPRQPDSWYTEKSVSKKTISKLKVPPIEKGMQKWKALPEPVDDTADILTIIPPDYDPDLRGSPDPVARRNTKQNMSMMKILEEWRSQWHLAGQYADSTPDDLIHDMADIQAHVRLKAVATVAKAVTYKPPTDPGIRLEHHQGTTDTVGQIPEKVFIALEYLLNDNHEQVKRAAAIALYSMDRPNEQAEIILREALKGDNSVDRWAAAQCLAHFGVCDAAVVGEIIQQLLGTEDSVKHERAITLLAKVSADSMLVHAMVAEHLNSSSWRHKVIACKVFPTLHANINKDITQKLANLMWNDWHKEVRSAAAQALGKTGHGKIVHDDLREKILNGPERTRVEAISRIGQLGIMTARLLPSYLQCFDDPYVSVRSEACITAGQIRIQEEAVIKKLVYMATYDNTWKVKALAVQTLGKIGVASSEVKACLLWALRYEEKEAVRAEACHSLIVLGVDVIDTDEMIDALQERLLVETSQLVRQQITDALKLVGINAGDDVDMVADIKIAVRKLCTRNNIASQIAVNEAAEAKAHNKGRMIHKPKQEPEQKSMEPQQSRASSRDDAVKRMKKRASSPVNYRPMSQGHYSKLSTPDFSRENTMGTPTVENEIQAVFRENTKVSTPDTGFTPVSTPRTKTRMTQTPSALSSGDTSSSQTSGGNKHLTEVTEDLDCVDTSAEAEEEQKLTTPTSNVSDICDHQRDRKEAMVSPDQENIQEHQHTAEGEADYHSLQKPAVTFKADEKIEDNQGNPEMPITEDHMSSFQPLKKHFKIQMTQPQTPTGLSDGVQSRSSSRRKLLSQELQVERDKVQLEAQKSYSGLDARYSSMVGHLDQVDNAFKPMH